MIVSDVKRKTGKALKWSVLTELLAKIIAPVINMILARILAPEAFGVLATVTMVLSFAEILVEAGFQKFLIQHDFDSSAQEMQYMSVAFWANLGLSLLIWFLLIIFQDKVAHLVGNDGLGFPIAVAGAAIPMYGIIGIQNSKLRKDLEFNRLFYVRMVSAVVPLLTTVPLALVGFDYWALIIGNIAGLLVRMILLAALGRFKPDLYFAISDLKQMFKVGIWTLMDGLAIWGTAWIDMLLISRYISGYYLGLYKNATATISAAFAIVTSALTPVLFSSLSKLQQQKEAFNDTFLKTQRLVAVILLPLGMGLYLYRDFATWILFGEAWAEASDIVGIMSITTALRVIFVSIYSEVFRAKGKFYLPFILQLVDLCILIPVCVMSVRNGFWSLVYARAFARLDLVIITVLGAWKMCGITLKNTWKTIFPAMIATVVMTGSALVLQRIGTQVIWSFVSIFICMAVYFMVLFLFKDSRKMLQF